jgi:hypothetical protein
MDDYLSTNPIILWMIQKNFTGQGDMKNNKLRSWIL